MLFCGAGVGVRSITSQQKGPELSSWAGRGFLCEFACSLYVCVGFLGVIWDLLSQSLSA